MKCHATFDEYLGDPIGSYLAGPKYFIWSHNACLGGLMFWGQPELESLGWLSRARKLCLYPSQGQTLIDLRHVESLTSTIVESLTDYLRAWAKQTSSSRPSVAVLSPNESVGIVMDDLRRSDNSAVRIEPFAEPYEALTWLGATDASAVVRELERVFSSLTTPDTILIALRKYLRENPGKAQLKSAAAALGMSGRALQRRLREANTSFQIEHNAVQIQLAKSLLCDTNHEIKRIAFEVGCSSVAAFSTLFRRIEGEAPRAWRSQTAPPRQPRG